MKRIDFRTLVTFQEGTQTKDTFGHVTETFTDILTTYAQVDIEQSDEAGYEREVMQEQATIVCRPVNGLTTKHRVMINEKPFNIISIKEKTRTWIEIKAVEIVE